MAEASVVLRDVSHAYGRRHALRHLSTRLGPGITGLLGPNGAGKSTLMKLLATALPVRAGVIEVNGTALTRRSRQGIRRHIGYLPQRFDLMDAATVRHNVEFAAWAHGIDGRDAASAAGQVLERLSLVDRADDRAGALSGGMRQRLGLACVLVHEPAVLLLDEPTVGLDPAQRREVRRALASASQSSLVLVSTHLVEDLAADATHVLVLADGEFRFDGSMTSFEKLGKGGSDGGTPLEESYFTALQGGAK